MLKRIRWKGVAFLVFGLIIAVGMVGFGPQHVWCGNPETEQEATAWTWLAPLQEDYPGTHEWCAAHFGDGWRGWIVYGEYSL